MENITQQLYNDFTTKLLPKIGEGLQITKEYFTDSIWLSLCIIFTIVGLALIYIGVKSGKAKDWDNPEIFMPLFLIGGAMLFIGFFGALVHTENLIKDIYIPEVRILEILKPIN